MIHISKFTICSSLLCLVLFATFAKGQNNHTVGQIQEAVANSDWSKAQTLVESLKKSDTSAFRSGEYDYLLGRLFDKQSNTSEAVSRFTVVASAEFVLSDYALWHLAQLTGREPKSMAGLLDG